MSRLFDLLRGRARLVGARYSDGVPGIFSAADAAVHLGLGTEAPADLERAHEARRTLLRDLAVVGRSLVTRAVAGPAHRGARERRPHVVAAHVDNLSIDDALAAIFAPAPAERARIVQFAHAHALTLARRDAELRDLFAQGDVTLPDGIGLRVAAALRGTPLVANVNGTDLFPRLCEMAAALAVPLVLVGGAPGIAATCAERMKERVPHLDVAEASHGFLSDEEAKGFALRLRARPGAIVLVGMGTPHQERWVARYLRDVPSVTVVTVGGLFDFYSGRIERAPRAVRHLGLEWLWRVKEEPRRLFTRYFLGGPLFLAYAALDARRERARRRSHGAGLHQLTGG